MDPVVYKSSEGKIYWDRLSRLTRRHDYDLRNKGEAREQVRRAKPLRSVLNSDFPRI